MSENQKSDGTSQTTFSVEIHIADDKRSATLKFKRGEEIAWITSFDTAALEGVIASLGGARSEMLEPVPELDGEVRPISAFNPRWHGVTDTGNRFPVLWLRHPGFGWSSFGFPRYEAGNIAKWLRKATSFTSTLDTQSPAASSFGGKDFLMTTEGLGYYYYGKGEKRIGPNPFEQIEFDSDRAAGIVAASIVEQRLEEALKSRIRNDAADITKNLFRPSGALGPFSTKIELAYLMRLLSDDAYKDLMTIKNIRNDFAHKLELDSFGSQSISDRCRNLKTVDRYVGPVPTDPSSADEKSTRATSFYFGLPDYEKRISDPRFRYVMTAQFISNELGAGAERSDSKLPLV